MILRILRMSKRKSSLNLLFHSHVAWIVNTIDLKNRMVIEAVCVLQGEEGEYGTLHFKQQGEGQPCVITGKISKLSPGKHGFNIHELGDRSRGCSTVGTHFNPRNVAHGAPSDCPGNRHYGDLGNIIADTNGVAKIDITDNLVSLVGPESVIGRAVVVHVDPDDCGKGFNAESKSTGNAGGSLACGVIGITRAH